VDAASYRDLAIERKGMDAINTKLLFQNSPIEAEENQENALRIAGRQAEIRRSCFWIHVSSVTAIPTYSLT
jgi:hypothetical protein